MSTEPSGLGAEPESVPGEAAGDEPAASSGAAASPVSSGKAGAEASTGERPPRGADRRAVLLRLDPAIHDALKRWADDELRSVNAQVEMIVRDALRKEGRLPRNAGPLPKRGRPVKE